MTLGVEIVECVVTKAPVQSPFGPGQHSFASKSPQKGQKIAGLGRFDPKTPRSEGDSLTVHGLSTPRPLEGAQRGWAARLAQTCSEPLSTRTGHSPRMSLVITIKGPEGIVMAAESRVTLGVQQQGKPGLQVFYDNATKLFGFGPPHGHIGVATYGLAVIGQRTAYGFLPEFEATLPSTRIPVVEFARLIQAFYQGQWVIAKSPADYAGTPMVFVVAGFDDGEAYGRVYEVRVPSTDPDPKLLSEQSNFTMSFGGQAEIVDRLMRGADSRLLAEIDKSLGLTDPQKQLLSQLVPKYQLPVPLDILSLQDCIDLELLFFRTTMAAQKLTVSLRGVGGETDLAVITRREGFRYIQRKTLHGEARREGGPIGS